MPRKSPVEIADKFSRKRAWLIAAAAVVSALNLFLQLWLSEAASRTRFDWWAINTVALLLVLATGGGLLLRPAVRALMNDEVTKSHRATAIIAGFWVAMIAAMGIYLTPGLRELSGRPVIHIVVSTGVSVALFVFAYLEIRSLRDV